MARKSKSSANPRFTPGLPVISQGRKPETGITTGGSYRCQLESCNGLRVAVRWPGGKITYPCTKGMAFSLQDCTWKIL